MKHKNSHLLVGYWGRIRKGRAVPDQTDIDPRAIKRMLSQVFILDATDPTRPMYRLAGTSVCDRFGLELRGTNFLSHWEGQSGHALASLLRQALRLKQPLCLDSIGATADSGMVEIETVLAPVSFGEGEPTRFIGMMQILGDASPVLGRTIAFERLVGSQFVCEDEPLSTFDTMPPPPPPFSGKTLRSHPRAPHLRLVINHERPQAIRSEAAPVRSSLDTLIDAFGEATAPGTKSVTYD
jgi:hypothetical protein